MRRANSRRSTSSRRAWLFVLALACCPFSARCWTASDPLAIRCEYGVTLALRGELAPAETVFVSLLSRSPSDPRALTNLGNIHLLRGDLETAWVFYDRAIVADSADCGIRLDRAVASMLLDDQERAIDEAAEGALCAGGEQAAGALLGMRSEGGTPDKGASRTRMSREDVRALLSAAVKGVPRDTTAAAPGAAPAKTQHKRPALTLRPAGPRGAGEAEAATLLYWKQ